MNGFIMTELLFLSNANKLDFQFEVPEKNENSKKKRSKEGNVRRKIEPE